jgi:phosphatidylserine/phosphatidylglycerophosphate/cardiolipin synthase-like enzyme
MTDADVRPTLLVDRAQATERLQDHVLRGGELLAGEMRYLDKHSWVQASDRWVARGTELLRSLFSTDEYSDRFAESAANARSYLFDSNDRGAHFSHLINQIQSALDNVDLIPPAPGAGDAFELTPERLRNVFLVHGHDHPARDAVAAFVRRLGLEVTILEDESGGGRTIIEQFEKHADVGFALVLLTGDDVGAARSSPTKLRPRARQNVILELGYFYGRLGRERVRALVKGDVDYPSDIGGVLYTKLDDAGAWQLSLAREMRDAQMAVDLNKL